MKSRILMGVIFTIFLCFILVQPTTEDVSELVDEVLEEIGE